MGWSTRLIVVLANINENHISNVKCLGGMLFKRKKKKKSKNNQVRLIMYFI